MTLLLQINTDYGQVVRDSFAGYGHYLLTEVLHPHWGNYFYWLAAISFAFWGLELAWPWRRNQGAFRQDFWLDVFYMFFNYFLFSLIVYNALSNVFVQLFKDGLALVGVHNLVAVEIGNWPLWARLLTLFVVRDFIQWNVHRLLHRVNWLWAFHQVHHSVEEMGFAAHLRYHPVETVVYRLFEYLPLALIGFGLTDFFLVHLFTLTVGHFNHANLYAPLGPFKYLFNNPQTHLWHHAQELPAARRHGVNFALTLTVWDYLFRTAYVPRAQADLPLGFAGVEHYPHTFAAQQLEPFAQLARPSAPATSRPVPRAVAAPPRLPYNPE